MEKLKIGNVWVQFPFVPYAPQEEFMLKMIETIQTSQNALLESPTGTGKTLCLLCASLAWLDVQKKAEEVPELYEELNQPSIGDDNFVGSDRYYKKYYPRYKVYFCTRTHSQLVQAVKEFQNTSYGYLRSSVLGSRKHLCLNPCAKQVLGNVDNKCRALRRTGKCQEVGTDIEDLPKKCSKCHDDHQCPWYTNYEKMISSGNDKHFTQCGALDQIRLIEKCQEYKVCPFYVSRHLQKQADISFVPYSYIFNPHILKGLQLNLKDSIVIIDEGHNLEKVCEENASFQMKASDAANCRDEVLSALKLSEDRDFPADIRVTDILKLEMVLSKLELIVKTRIRPGIQVPHYNGQDCLKFFEEAGFTHTEYNKLLYHLKELTQFLGEMEIKTDGMKKIHDVVSTIFYLDSDTTETLESTLKENFVLYKEDIKPEDVTKEEPRVFFWCFDAGIIMKSLRARGVRSFIVTSGTLSPLKPLKESLSIPFQVELLNEHVVERSQVLSLCINKAPNCKGDMEVPLEASYNFRQEHGDQLYSTLGNVVREVVKSSPKGLLIFFPSSKVKEDCLKKWDQIVTVKNGKRITLWDEINSLKVVFEEPKEARELHDLQKKYNAQIEKSSGACLIGVLSGKVSEGIDFKDDLGRAVIMVGLPYPPLFDPWVIYKRQHLSKKHGAAAEGAWYLSQAIRPVNQALGRIIRHQQDYGCILLSDCRFSSLKIRNGLPQWVERNLESVEFQNLGHLLKKFFSTIPLRMKEIKRKSDKEQAKICCRHREALKEEECHSDKYLDLLEKRDSEREKEKQLKVDTQEILREYRRKSDEILHLRRIVEEKEAALRREEAIMVQEEANQKMETSQVLKQEYDSDCESDGDSEWDGMTPNK